MTKLIAESEVARLRAASEDSFQKRLYRALTARAYRNTRCPGFVQPGDTQEWWHLCWERASDAAFTWYMERDEKLGQWIRDVAFWMRDREDTEWIGPWFRSHERPLKGNLETAHVCLAMCEILWLCGELFSGEEKKSLEEALRVKGMEPCRLFVVGMQEARTSISNWYDVLLMGYGVCALYFDDEDAIHDTLLYLRDAYSLYNADSYGESVQYSNYATLTLAHLNELILRMRPDYANMVDIRCYGRMMKWYASSFLYMKQWDKDDETVYPRIFNFADCAAAFRPTGDVLVQIAARLADSAPRDAALASWLFETTYAYPEQGPDELATFGFYNHFRYHAVLMQPDMAKAKSPAEVGLCETMTFENGQVIERDSWEDTRAALAVQAGYVSMNVTSSHRHEDNGAFQFMQGRERMIIDGGHCCYRTVAQKYSHSTSQHATVDFVDDVWCAGPGLWQYSAPYYAVIGQKLVDGNIYIRKNPMVHNLINRYVGSKHVLSFDMSDVYDERITSVRRAFVTALPNAIFIIDMADTAKPLRMRTHFPVNNRDNALNVHRADDHRYVFRRGGEAMKLFECLNMLDGEVSPSALQFDWGYCHRNYHPLANMAGQSREGSAQIYNWIDSRPAQKHLRVCAIASDVEPRITGWHIKPDENGDWYIESPEKVKVLQLRVRDGAAYVLDGGEWIRVL